jgi:hypothetical protein
MLFITKHFKRRCRMRTGTDFFRRICDILYADSRNNSSQLSSTPPSRAKRCGNTSLTAPRSVLVIWMVDPPSTNRAQHCLTLVIKWGYRCVQHLLTASGEHVTWAPIKNYPGPFLFDVGDQMAICMSNVAQRRS